MGGDGKNRPIPSAGWLPDFVLKGNDGNIVYVECKGGLKWDNVPHFPELTRYQDAVIGTSCEVLLIPEAPKRMENDKGYPASILGLLYDGSIWSYAELSRWSGRVGFCHAANSWKDRMSGESVQGMMGDGQRPCYRGRLALFRTESPRQAGSYLQGVHQLTHFGMDSAMRVPPGKAASIMEVCQSPTPKAWEPTLST